MLKLSHSSMSTYDQCPFKWKLKYIDRLPERPKHYFSFGQAVHSALEHMYSGDSCPAADQVVQAFLSAWSDAGFKDDAAIRKGKREGEAMLRAYHAAHAAEWRKPLGVELRFSFMVHHVPVGGVIDRLDILPDGTLHVIDYKTGRELEPGRAESDQQLTMYQAAAARMFPESEVSEVSFLHVPTGATLTAPARGPDRLCVLESTILRTHAAMSTGEFPCKPSEAACQWCDFKALCPAWLS